MLAHNRELALLRQRVLEAAAFAVSSPDSDLAAIRLMEQERFDVVIVCHSVPKHSAKKLLSVFRQHNPDACVICVSLNTTRKPGSDRSEAHVYAGNGPEALIKEIQSCGRP